MKKKFLVLPLLASMAVTFLSGCSFIENFLHPSKEETSEATFVDYVNNGSVKLELDYQGRDFYVDGVGQFDLKSAIDGDTAHFTPKIDSKGKGLMKARFYGIDTPESTGKVQEYGKPASNFTKEKLLEAAENGTIVVSSAQNEYKEPNPDSTGERYVSLVWVNLTKKNAPYDELVLLNLWIVQEGLSYVKSVSSMPQYADTFYAAESQAREFKLNMFSGEPDPYFNYGEYQDVSLLDVKREIELSMKDPNHENIYNNAKIRFTGAVCGYSKNILYVQEYYPNDPDDLSQGGEYAGINIFVGMSPILSKFTEFNTYLRICGLAQDSENFGFQVTDTQGKYKVEPMDENDVQVLLTAEENIDEHSMHKFSYTSAELNDIAKAGSLVNLNCLTEVTNELEVSRAFISSSSDKEITLYFKNCEFNAYITFAYKGDPNRKTYRWVLEEDFVGKKFKLTGVYVYHYTTSGKLTFQICPSSASELVWVQE